MAWDDFWEGANKNLAAGANIGAEAALKSLAAKIQARQDDKKNLFAEMTAAKKREQDVADAERQNAFVMAENEKGRASSAQRDNTTLDTEYLRVLKTPKSKWSEEDKAIHEAYKELKAPKPESRNFNKDERIANILSKPKAQRTSEDQDYLDYYKSGGSSDVPHEAALAAAKQNVEREVNPKKERASYFQEQLDNAPTPEDSSAVQPLLDKAVHELDSTYQANPLIDQYQEIKGANQQVSPEQAASVTQELATLKQQLAELLKLFGVKQ